MWRVNPLRCMRGALTTAPPTNISVIGLFNNSTGAHLINVLGVGQNPSKGTTIGFYVTKTRLTTQNSGVVTPVVTDEAPGPGQIDNDDLASPQTVDYFSPDAAFATLELANRYPLAVLRPGWSLVVVGINSFQPIGVCFYWEWCYAEELFRLSAGDSADGE